jgi:hypothetical protein
MQPAYNGKDKYIFVSYAHKDNDLVLPFIEELQKKFNVWYDAGIRYGQEWEEEILEKLNGCFLFLFFVTENSLNSENCSDEIYKAREEKKNFINIVFDSKIKLSEKFMFRYGRYQMCFVDKFKSYEAAIADLSSKCDWFNEVVKKDSIISDTESEESAEHKEEKNQTKVDDNSVASFEESAKPKRAKASTKASADATPIIPSTNSNASAPTSEKVNDTINISELENLRVGDTFEFGRYDSEKSPIVWRVLSINDDNLFVVSDKLLENLPFNNTKKDVTWEDSSIRRWLNGAFLSVSFNKNEQKLISLTNVSNKPNSKYGTSSGNDTQDKIFLLSEEEVNMYLTHAQCSPTNTLRPKLFGWRKSQYYIYLLRTSGKNSKNVCLVNENGFIWHSFIWSSTDNRGIRPAMNLNLKLIDSDVNDTSSDSSSSSIPEEKL